MRFAQHLSSHLTPEWRKYYIDYEDLKKKVYHLASKKPSHEAEEDVPIAYTQYLGRGNGECRDTFDVAGQDEFFEEAQRQLDGINSFYRAREAELSHNLHNLLEEVHLLETVQLNPRTRHTRSTYRKRESLKMAMCEFYLHLSLLQNFQQLNYTGFRKILKKHDKLTRCDRGGVYFKQVVCQSDFYTSKRINSLIATTEETMIERLEGGNRSKAMNRLRVPPLGGEKSIWAALRAGWLMGVIFISLVVIAIAFGFRYRQQPWTPDAGVLIGLRAGFILVLWLFGFAINTFFWRRAGVNNVLIFEFNPRNHLDFVQLFEVASLAGVIWCIGLMLFIFSRWLDIPEYVGPVVGLALTLGLFLLPLPIIYHSSRLWLVKELGRILLAPFFVVTFADFWIADQLNSLAVVLLDLEFFLCYLVYGQHAPQDSIFQCGSIFYGLRPLVAVLPAWWRFAQCLRRYYNTRKVSPHLVNAGKYSTSFVVVIFSTTATALQDPDADLQSVWYYGALALWIMSAIVSSIYTFTWDIRMDWGLFEKGYLLRRELIYQHKIWYFLAVVENLIFRSLWTITFSVGEGGSKVLNNHILRTVLAVMEVFRRFVWNFFRLENEHLNNCGQFRAVRDISVRPLDLSELHDEAEFGGQMVTKVFRNIAKRASFPRKRAETNGLSTSIARRPIVEELPLDYSCDENQRPSSVEKPSTTSTSVETEFSITEVTV